MEKMRIEEEPPIDDEFQPIETFVEYESVTDFKSKKNDGEKSSCMY
jgi:hypothetical protein